MLVGLRVLGALNPPPKKKNGIGFRGLGLKGGVGFGRIFQKVVL